MIKTVQMTIDEDLLTQVDTLVKELETNRSAFMREALENALKQRRVRLLEQQHRAGYERHPQTPDEFDIWQEEQVWGTNS